MPAKLSDRITINLSEELAAKAEARMREGVYRSFSAYVADLIDADVRARPWVLRGDGKVFFVDPPHGAAAPLMAAEAPEKYPSAAISARAISPEHQSRMSRKHRPA